MKLTSNYSLKKPDGSDVVNIQDINDNSDKIDLELKKVDSQLKDMGKNLSKLSNPNLLINGDFQVRQRGNSFTTSGYTVDRWFATSDKGISVTAHKEGVIVKNIEVGSWHNFETRIEIPNSLQGATLTFSIQLNNAYVYRQIYINDRTNNKNLVAKFGTTAVTQDSATFVVPNNCSILTFGIQVQEVLNAQLDIRYCKLEAGKSSTLLIPKSYAEELLACQRYYQICRVPAQTVLGDTNGQVAITVPLITALRIASPTIKAWADSGIWLHPQTGGLAIDFLGNYLVNIFGSFQMIILENIGNPEIKNQEIYSVNSSNESDNISSGIATITIDSEIY
ncbi:hypothetical protein FDB29_05460 [Clostridium botulinum]|nr:hypothetical protein [Clostridium botulinum]